MQQTYYCAQTPTQRKRRVKQTIVKKIVNARIQNEYEIVNVGLEVPALSPSELVANNIIIVTYHIRVCSLGSVRTFINT